MDHNLLSPLKIPREPVQLGGFSKWYQVRIVPPVLILPFLLVLFAANLTCPAAAQPGFDNGMVAQPEFSLDQGLTADEPIPSSQPTPTPVNKYRFDPEIEEIRQLFGVTDQAGEGRDSRDIYPPLVTNLTPEKIPAGEPVTFTVKVQDNSPNPQVFVHYRNIGADAEYIKVPMSIVSDAQKGLYEVTLPDPVLNGKGIHFFFEAVDQTGNKGYSTIDLEIPHLLLLESSARFLPWILVGFAGIIIPTLIILIRRRMYTRKEEQRTAQLRKFISRQKQLDQERKRLYKRHLEQMQGYKRVESDQASDAGLDEEVVELEGTSRTAPPIGTGGGARERQRDSGSRHPVKTKKPPAGSHPSKAEEILKQFDDKFAKKRPKQSFDLDSEVRKLLNDQDLKKQFDTEDDQEEDAQ
ncbi:hypothetical protein JW905_18835 [bacterium]|nr:hypothetical protein [candidate division CSSED10-310 bacterium]